MKKLSVFVLFLIPFCFLGQDIEYARSIIKKLSSKQLHGRGYVKQGDLKAAEYIANQFKKNGVSPLGSSYFQSYNLPINTFPGKIRLSIDRQKLKPGTDWVISSSSPSINRSFNLIHLPDTITTDSGFLVSARSIANKDVFLVTTYLSRKLYGKDVAGFRGVVVIDTNVLKLPGWHVSNGNKVSKTCWLKVKNEALAENASSLTISVGAEYYSSYKTQNVLGFVRGKKYPDRYLVFTAHYDHLGMMGNKTYFPGANDNASGTAMVLDLARYYSMEEHQPDYSIIFMLFSGEESGLNGSKWYVKNPIVRLEQMYLLVNLDMIGTGSEGITVVNGKAYNDVITEFKAINDTKKYLKEIKARGEACNSDHCPFYQTGVKSIFIYTRGKEHTDYHTISDKLDEQMLTAYEGLFRLLTDYAEKIQE